MERAEGDVRSVGTECYDVCSVQDKVTLGSGESTRATSNGVNLRERNVTKRSCTKVGQCYECRVDAVPIGRHPMSRPGEGG